MDKEIKKQINANNQKISQLIDQEIIAGDNLSKGMIAVFGTGAITLLSLLTPMPTKIFVGACAIANIYTVGTLFHGFRLQDKIDVLDEKNKKLKNKYVLVKERIDKEDKKPSKVKKLKI